MRAPAEIRAALQTGHTGAVSRLRRPSPLRLVHGLLVPVFTLALVASPPAHAKDTGLIFVSNEKSNNLIVLDPKTYQIVKDIKVSRRPRDMHFSADRSKLYVACGDDDVIDIVDVAKLEVIGKLATGPSPETFAIDEKRRRLYVANEEGSTLSIIDIDQNITSRRCRPGPSRKACSSARTARSCT